MTPGCVLLSAPMTVLEIKQELLRMSKRGRQELHAYLIRLKHETPESREEIRGAVLAVGDLRLSGRPSSCLVPHSFRDGPPTSLFHLSGFAPQTDGLTHRIRVLRQPERSRRNRLCPKPAN